MSQEIAKLYGKRTYLKGQLTRFRNQVEENFARHEIAAVRVAIEKTRNIWQSYEDLHVSLLVAEPEKEHEHNRELESFQNLYIAYMSKAETAVNTEPQAHGTANASSPITEVGAAIRLPQIKLNSFDGNHEHWLSFRDSFKSLIDGDERLTDMQKMHYLRSALSGEAADVIGNIETTNANYKVAWNMLTDEYDNHRKIVRGHIQAILDLPTFGKDSASRKQWYHTLKMNIRSLSNLNQQTWDTLLTCLLWSKLDSDTTASWEKTLTTKNMPTLKDFLSFIERKKEFSENEITPNSSGQTPYSKNRPVTRQITSKQPPRIQKAFVTARTDKPCNFCSETHAPYVCPVLARKTVDERYEVVNKKQLCKNCLHAGHRIGDCTAGTCRVCNRKHHTLLHKDLPLNKTHTNTNYSMTLNTQQSSPALLSTALVCVQDSAGQTHSCRVILDCGSQSNFMTDNLAAILELPRTKTNVEVATIDNNTTTIQECVNATLKSQHSQFKVDATFLIVPQITQPTPEHTFDKNILHLPKGIKLADPRFHVRSGIDALLGVELYYRILYSKQIKLTEPHVILQASHLGWIVSANPIQCNASRTQCHVSARSIEQTMEKFWKIDDVPTAVPLSKEEELCEKLYTSNTQRLANGQYQVRLPFKEPSTLLGQSYGRAFKRFLSWEARFRKDPYIREQYGNFMREYLELGHMREVTTNDRKGYYLPHQAITKESSNTTKVRVVFDGSAKTTSGISLNETLLSGPTIQDDILTLVLRFRLHKFVLTADVEKMYRQVAIHPDDRKYQRILWRFNDSHPLRTYELTTVTYGLTPAPYLAVRSLHQLAEDEIHNYPVAAQILKTDFYVDDLLTGAPTLEEAENIRDELIPLLRSGGFHLRQWSSNDPRLIGSLPQNDVNEQALFEDNVVKALGINWRPGSDQIRYFLSLPDDSQPSTKRSILSTISRLFDPMGLLGPVIVESKLIMRELWLRKCDWDTPVPDNLQTRWREYINELAQVENIILPRRVVENDREMELHGFCDASEQAYGACIYLRTRNHKGNHITRLLCSKSRVAPVKVITLPRLELCAASLLTNLFTFVVQALKRRFSRIVFWTDSTIVLRWIETEPRKLKTFVANRVANIQRLDHNVDWRHVKSEDNPADVISRGQLPSILRTNSLWFTGPAWLQRDESYWPISQLQRVEITELRVSLATRIVTEDKPDEILLRFSSFTSMKRVIAYCWRFYQFCRQKKGVQGCLSSNELNLAENSIIKLIQKGEFQNEMRDLEKGPVKKNSPLLALAPFLDDNGLIRVGGRLRKSDLQYGAKHPLVLPGKNHVTKLIVTHYHNSRYHAGVQGTLYAVREQYWPIQGRKLIKDVIRSCIKCFRYKPPISQHIMGQLPLDRTILSRPFLNTGVDYCGPFLIKESKLRNRKKIKAYAAIFICLATKAIHVEIVSDLTSTGFIAALKRFISRRGRCTNIYSDNGTTFIGAERELRETLKFTQGDTHNDIVTGYTASLGIRWHFIPPRAPHFGGLWEAGVKAFKKHLYRTIGNALYTYEEFTTYAAEIEAILNSRPLTPMSSDPNDLTALTPAHFLIGDTLTGLPEEELSATPTNRLSRWQHLQQIKQHLWRRWRKEYLNELQVRAKWHLPAPNVQVGTLVLLHEDNTPSLHWPLGRIIATHPGEDGVVRVVTIRTTSGDYKRSVKRVSPLPMFDGHTE